MAVELVVRPRDFVQDFVSMQVLYVDPVGAAIAEARDPLDTISSSVTVARSAADALGHVADRQIDVLVSEQALPDADGLELLGRTRVIAPDLPFVVYTASGSESLAGEFFASGADGYVTKAAGPDVLARRVAAVAEKRPARSESSVATGSDHPADGTSDRFSALVDQAPLGIIELDHDLRAVSWNPAASEIFGYDRNDALGRSAGELVVPESTCDTVDSVWRSVIESGDVSCSVMENVRADGSTTTCEWRVAPLLDDGSVAGVLSFVRDATDEAPRSDGFEGLQDATSELMAVESKEAVVDTVTDSVASIFDQQFGVVSIYDADRCVLEAAGITRQSRDTLDVPVDDLSTIGPGDALEWDVFESGDPAIVESTSGHASIVDDVEAGQSLLVQPIGDHGVFVIGRSTSDAFDETDLRMSSVLGSTAATAMDSAVRTAELEFIETIIEAAGDGVIALDSDGRFVRVNDRFVEMVGTDRDELIGSYPSSFLSEADVERGQRHVEELVAGESTVASYDVTIQQPDGTERPVEINQSTFVGDRFSGTVGTVRDISDRLRIQSALRDRRDKIVTLHDVATRLDDCETVDDIASISVAAAADVLNFDSCMFSVIDDDQLAVMARSGSTFEGQSEYHSFEGTIAARAVRSGEPAVVNDVSSVPGVSPIHPESKSILSVPLGDRGVLQAASTTAGVFDEVDAELVELLAAHVTNSLDRVSFEAQLRSEHDRMAALFDNVPDPVVSVLHTDDGPIVQSVNRAFEDVFGFDSTEITGESLDDFIVPESERHAAARLNERGVDGEVVERELRRRTADGLKEFLLTVVPVDLGYESPATFGVYSDVTEQKQRRERVEVLNRVLRHDLRNGLNIVRGSAEMIAESADDDLMPYAESIIDQSEELLSLADRTRAVERAFDRGDRSLKRIDVVAVLEEVVEGLEKSYPAAEISTSFSPTTGIRGSVLLEYALLDVIENAIVHNDRQSPSVSVDVSAGSGDAVIVSVADDGPGIPETERRLLTGKDEITQLRHAGGLGLWLLNWAVTHAGGELSFDDNDPRGSIVTMRLPVADVRAREPSLEKG